MRGETVVVFLNKPFQKDEMGELEPNWEAYEVQNVLVRPTTASTNRDIADQLRPEGVLAQYTLAFPKTASNITVQLRGARVSLIERGMNEDPDEALWVIGDADITTPCPTAWNALVNVGRAYG